MHELTVKPKIDEMQKHNKRFYGRVGWGAEMPRTYILFSFFLSFTASMCIF